MCGLLGVRVPFGFGIAPSTLQHQAGAAKKPPNERNEPCHALLLDATDAGRFRRDRCLQLHLRGRGCRFLGACSFSAARSPGQSDSLAASSGFGRATSGFIPLHAGAVNRFYAVAWLARRMMARALDRLEEKFQRNVTARFSLAVFCLARASRPQSPPASSRSRFGWFAAITGCAVLVWVVAIFGLTKLFGTQALIWLGFVENRIKVAVFGALVRSRRRPAWKRLGFFAKNAGQSPVCETSAHWEFWPAWLFYLPVAVYYGWLTLRFRSLQPCRARRIPGFQPAAWSANQSARFSTPCAGSIRTRRRRLPDPWPDRDRPDRCRSTESLRKESITLPFILKPDVGQRGDGVKLIRSLRAALDYLQQVDAPVIVQRYAPGPHEVGRFLLSFP